MDVVKHQPGNQGFSTYTLGVRRAHDNTSSENHSTEGVTIADIGGKSSSQYPSAKWKAPRLVPALMQRSSTITKPRHPPS